MSSPRSQQEMKIQRDIYCHSSGFLSVIDVSTGQYATISKKSQLKAIKPQRAVAVNMSDNLIAYSKITIRSRVHNGSENDSFNRTLCHRGVPENRLKVEQLSRRVTFDELHSELMERSRPQKQSNRLPFKLNDDQQSKHCSIISEEYTDPNKKIRSRQVSNSQPVESEISEEEDNDNDCQVSDNSLHKIHLRFFIQLIEALNKQSNHTHKMHKLTSPNIHSASPIHDTIAYLLINIHTITMPSSTMTVPSLTSFATDGQIQNLTSEMAGCETQLMLGLSNDEFIQRFQKLFLFQQLSGEQLIRYRFSQYKRRANHSGQQQSERGLTLSNNQKVSRFGRFHNFNKLFMYCILNMFNYLNLRQLNVPSFIASELQHLIKKIKMSAKNNYKVQGKYAFDYFSHAHYNVLFLQLTEANIIMLIDQPDCVALYQACFNLNIAEQPIPPSTLAYVNIVKFFAYLVFTACVGERDILQNFSNGDNADNLKNQYSLKVIKGIEKLALGTVIKRF